MSKPSPKSPDPFALKVEVAIAAMNRYPSYIQYQPDDTIIASLNSYIKKLGTGAAVR